MTVSTLESLSSWAQYLTSHVTRSPDTLFGHDHSFALTKSVLAAKIKGIAVKFDSSQPCGLIISMKSILQHRP